MLAISTNLIDATTAAVAQAGTSVAPATVPADNTHTMVVLNPSNTQTVYLNFGTAGGALPPATSVNILPGNSLSVAIGALSSRPTSGSDIIFDATGAVDVRVFYLNGSAS